MRAERWIGLYGSAFALVQRMAAEQPSPPTIPRPPDVIDSPPPDIKPVPPPDIPPPQQPDVYPPANPNEPRRM